MGISKRKAIQSIRPKKKQKLPKRQYLLRINIAHCLCLKKIWILVFSATSYVNPISYPVLSMYPSITTKIQDTKNLACKKSVLMNTLSHLGNLRNNMTLPFYLSFYHVQPDLTISSISINKISNYLKFLIKAIVSRCLTHAGGKEISRNLSDKIIKEKITTM